MKPIKTMAVVFVALYVVMAANMFFVHSLFVNGSTFTLGSIKPAVAFSDQDKAAVILGTSTAKSIHITPKPTLSPTLTPPPTPTPIGNPVSIEIPRLLINTAFVEVGVLDDNTMETPTDFSTVGWYKEGVRPGEIGAAIINGHYDDVRGNPAVFYNLSKLEKGDKIIINTSLNKSITFIVDSSYSQEYSSFPKELVYAPFQGRGLRLITCDGVWNAKEKTYSKRLVVSAQIVEN